ncbi:hypothetical protein Cgig2_025937 [Carnegiea gigantea]|uniref:SWIM-type domain-containing protein n=1 Tax=Carnegiea gigantea TaxID=171969 RepID=A0A9Q1JZ40_9CARY|nr:hypothetical protein Cgig2_025937 [Carnegiea gigantea]
MLDVLRLVEEVMEEGLRGQLMWYSLNCNRMELLPLGQDADVGKLMKGNDEYVYVYVAESEGRRIEMKLRKTLANIGCVAHVKLFNTALGEYGVSLTNNQSLVVSLARRTCSCKWWQLQGLPCAHAMVVIHKHKLWVYDYVRDCYKGATQGTIYMNSIHLMETHDSATVDNATGLVVGGEALDDGYNRRILPPINSRPQGRPRQRRIESQTHGVQMRRCSKCR